MLKVGSIDGPTQMVTKKSIRKKIQEKKGLVFKFTALKVGSIDGPTQMVTSRMCS